MLKILLNLVLKLILGVLSGFALQTVKNLEGVDLTNSEKRTQAFETIKNTAQNQGKELTTSIINLAIEASLNVIRRE